MLAPCRASAFAMPRPMPLVEPVTRAVLPLSMGSLRGWLVRCASRRGRAREVSDVSFAMTDPTLNYVPCPDDGGGHRMAYWSWGDAGAPHVVVCVHGLSRQGRDFDVLAPALRGAQRRRRCASCARTWWAAAAATGCRTRRATSCPPMSATCWRCWRSCTQQAPIAHAVDWVGTSMGGLIGMALAGTPTLPLPAPVRRLVLNDVGPVIQWQALQRIGTYLGQTGRFATVQQAADAMWADLDRLRPAHARAVAGAVASRWCRPLPEGGFTLHYDPAIAVPFRAHDAGGRGAGRRRRSGRSTTRSRARTLLLRGARVRPAVARHRAGDDAARSARDARRVRRRGPCADAGGRRPGRGRRRLPADERR